MSDSRQDLAHRGRQPIGVVTRSDTIVLRDQSADRYACIGVEQWQHCLPDRTPDILVLDVDAVRASRGQLGRKIGRTVVDRRIEAQFVLY
jgi:hypothetical protein